MFGRIFRTILQGVDMIFIHCDLISKEFLDTESDVLFFFFF